nr:MAG TPA: hypothetical protein [Caudoviricetes sp.]DAW31962.1 MAG TPA: hypothetical protein [Caudoviricetes sp.]DAZ38321.1 MAG TPA: hypothetical protein [Caudoviricetes sp.]
MQHFIIHLIKHICILGIYIISFTLSFSHYLVP